MCHQSVGLISREIEARGVPTLSMTSAWSITASAHPPRAAFTDFPLGHTCGPPHRPDRQRDIMRQALVAFSAINRPGTIVDLGQTWGEKWKAEARRPIDHRSPRYDAPQYQTGDDRRAAVAAHGREAACGVGSVPAAV